MAKNIAQESIRIVRDSHVPLGEDEEAFYSIRSKVERGERVTKEEAMLLDRLVEKAKEWEKAIRSSAETEPEDTLSG